MEKKTNQKTAFQNAIDKKRNKEKLTTEDYRMVGLETMFKWKMKIKELFKWKKNNVQKP